MELNVKYTNKKENRKINISNFNFKEDINIILRLVIERMKEIEENIKKNKPLPSLGIKKDLKGQPYYKDEYRNNENLNFNVNELYNRGISLANKIIMQMSCRKIPYNDISVNILLDCSGFINIENKL